MKQIVLQTLQELDKLRNQSGNAYWNIEWQTGELLAQLVRLHKPHNIVEIGTSTGFSGVWLASAAAEYGGQLITVDSFKDRKKIADVSFAAAELDNVISILGHAPECFGEFTDKVIDMVFIDASKRDYIKFYKHLKPQLSNGALIIADNTISHAEYMQDYLDLVRTENDSMSLDIDKGLEITIYKKPLNG